MRSFSEGSTRRTRTGAGPALAAYRSLGAGAVLLLWLYVPAYSAPIGAFINAEAERHNRASSAPVADMSTAEAVTASPTASARPDQNGKKY